MHTVNGSGHLKYTGDSFSEFNLTKEDQEITFQLKWEHDDAWKSLAFTFTYPGIEYKGPLLIDFETGHINHPAFTILHCSIVKENNFISLETGITWNDEFDTEHFTLEGKVSL